MESIIIYEKDGVVAETIVQSGTTSVTYNVWGLDLSGTMQGAGGIGGLLAVIRDGEPFFPCYDANGNITEYLDTNGVIVAHYEYDPFGNIIIESGSLANTFTHRFSTKPWCEVTRLSEYEYRKYSPRLGRWLSRDPIGEESFHNQRHYGKSSQTSPYLIHHSLAPVYVFLQNSPVQYFDMLGLWPWSQYTEDKNNDGSTMITIKKKCTIVVLFGHGLNTKKHIFKFTRPCTAGGFVGCDAGTTNLEIPEENRIDDVRLSDGEVYLGGISGSLPEEKQFHYWLEKARIGAHSKAKELCKSEKCCCSKIIIYGELAGSAWSPENLSFPKGWTDTIKCKEVK